MKTSSGPDPNPNPTPTPGEVEHAYEVQGTTMLLIGTEGLTLTLISTSNMPQPQP